MSIAVALLQGIAGGLLVVLFFVIIAGALLSAAVFGGALESRTERPSETPGTGLFLGRILCATGLAFAVVGAFYADVSTNIVGILLGLGGYYLGARVFGIVTMVASTITLIIGLLIGPGNIPGVSR